ncbi:MAG TPA: dTDP-4-dehydrorhamnose reductase [Sphingomicrobium sp.]|nr:dTDP-4-dehydrorhamnose reductase [Sphingomicrobium sp.]
MKALVTGRHGQLARSLGERSANHPSIELEFAGRPEIDLAVEGSAAAAIARLRPNVVINAAAYTAVDQAEDEPELAMRINAQGAREVAEAADSIGAPIIQVSTDYVFDGTSERAYREDDETGPISVYGASKLRGEEAAREANPRHLIVRTSWVVSPFGRNFVRTMVEAARSREVLNVVDDQRGRPTSALDLADALLAILDRWAAGDMVGQGRTYHVANAGEASWFELAREIMDECRRVGAPAAEVRPIASSEWPTKAERPRNSVLDCSRFEEEFRWEMPDWRPSVRAIVRRLAAV